MATVENAAIKLRNLSSRVSQQAHITTLSLAMQLAGSAWEKGGLVLSFGQPGRHGSAELHKLLTKDILNTGGVVVPYLRNQGAILYWNGRKYLFCLSQIMTMNPLMPGKFLSASKADAEQAICEWLEWLAARQPVEIEVVPELA